jgi:small subunit ribosomal protein S9
MAIKKTITKKIAKKSETKSVKKEEKKAKEVKPTKEKYYQGLGRRKTSIARVKMFEISGKSATPDNITVNGRIFTSYFTVPEMRDIVSAPLKALDLQEKFRIEARVKGGGIHGQADAVRLGISRAIRVYDANFAKTLRDLGYLTRDARKVERKKPGLKKARRAPQWQKR